MITGDFEYHSPASVDEAVSLLSQLGDDAKLLAGGHGLFACHALPGSLRRAPHRPEPHRGLAYLREGDGHLTNQAMTREVDL